MTEGANKLIVALREDAEWAQANEWETPITLSEHLDEAADLIESLSAQFEQVEKERDGLNIMLAQAQAMLETRTRERDAAVQDLEMCCPCEVCTRSCKYDKVNAYDECADFEWRGVEVEW